MRKRTLAERFASVHIRLHKAEGFYQLRHWVFDPRIGASIGWGQPESVGPNLMNERGLELVLTSLAEYPNRDPTSAETRYRENDEEASRSLNDFHEVSISINAGGRLKIVPLHRARGGRTSHYGARDTVRVLARDGQRAFIQSLRKAFARCT